MPAPDVVLVAGRDPLDEPGGGHSSYVRSHARAVLRLGFTPHLFCAGRDDAEVVTDFGVIHRSAAQVRPVRQLLAGLHAPRIAAAIARFAAGRRGPLLVHGFGVWGYAGVLACARLRAAGCEAIPIVSSYTTYESESRSLLCSPAGYGWRARLRYGAAHLWIRLAVAGWERRAYCESERVLLNYESVRRLVAARYGAAARCVKLTYASEAAFLHEGQPAPHPRAAEWTWQGIAELAEQLGPPGAPLIVAVSRHDPRKGWDVLLAALDRLRRQGVPFRTFLAGGGPHLAADRALAHRLGLGGSSVALVGEVPDPYPYLQRADVFVLPSRSEQSGSLSLLEALQAGCAVVASRVDGIPEDVVDGASALLVEPGDPEALAGALARLLGDASLRRRLATGARMVFEERFSACAFAAALGRVYAELGVVAEAQEPQRSDGVSR
ncbi:MAG TPA: glycosyltransferase family 4 protein [Thermoanaerobaculia bacterium]|nr:glycosyltransferase family 4 protein [Thermoanaerobaculia bacterium]